MRICSTEGCDKKHYGRGLCRRHYQRQTHILKMKREWVDLHKERRKETLKRYHATEKYSLVSKRYRSSMEGRYKKLIKGAKDRNLLMNITFEQYLEIFGDGICFYCENNVGPGTSLDRKDNNKGYEKDNVLVCCNDCNKLRQNRLTCEETVEVVKLIKSLRNTQNIWDLKNDATANNNF